MEQQRARLFDREADRYDRSRPGYPAAMIDAVLGPDPQGLSVLDVACGTGIASRLMTARGAHVLGVELSPRMAEVAQRHGVDVEVGAFETWDPAGRTFDRVTCGQAWHWLDRVPSARKAASLLRGGGRLCIFWSIGRHPDGLAGALQAVYERVVPPASAPLNVAYGSDRLSGGRPDVNVVVDELSACAGLDAPQVAWFPWTRTYTRDMWIDELGTHSDHIALAPEVREALLAEVGAVIDGFGGAFDMPYDTVLISASRQG